MIGVILAGGKATRLGPLTAQLNKSLVTIGQKPMLIRQVEQLRDAGCVRVLVVVSPGSLEQVESVIERAGLRSTICIVQNKPLGPVNAITRAVGPSPLLRDQDPVIVMAADTLIDGDDLPSGASCDTFVVAPAPSSRQWCVLRDGVWYDEDAPVGSTVSIGVEYFDSAAALWGACLEVGDADGMAPLLNKFPDAATMNVGSWQDVGDVPALVQSQKQKFTSRSFNTVHLTDQGLVMKRGHGEGFDAETEAIREPRGASAGLYPRFAAAGDDWYLMEHIDLPSLAELWLYWPSVPSMWAYITGHLMHVMDEVHWGEHDHDEKVHVIRKRGLHMWHDKIGERYEQPGNVRPWLTSSPLVVNGQEVLGGRPLIKRMLELGAEFRNSSEEWWGNIHGDLNFTNVMWSLRTSNFKLLDPRGEWGGPGGMGDIRYDLGKMAFSPEYSAIAHGLFQTWRTSEGWRLDIWPQREVETAALQAVLLGARWTLPLTVWTYLRAYMFLGSAPLHDPPESDALYLAGALELSRLAA